MLRLIMIIFVLPVILTGNAVVEAGEKNTDVAEQVNLIGAPDDEGVSVVSTIGGEQYYIIDTAGTMYFNIDNSFALRGNWANMVMKVDYLNKGNGKIILEYDSADTDVQKVKTLPGAFKTAGEINLTDSGKVLTKTFVFDDMYCGARCNGGDFRFIGNQPFAVRNITLEKKYPAKKVSLPKLDVYQRMKLLFDKDVTIGKKVDGFRGIWYQCGDNPGEYIYKYSGGLGTYCAKHRPFVIYRPEVNKTFFCYGGAREDNNQRLVHMVSYFDHNTKMVAKPTLLLDKKTSDAHDNPVISIDREGYIWIFSTSHGTGTPSYIHKSKLPYDIDAFELIDPVIMTDSGEQPFYNFSYFQAWNVPDEKFVCFMTLYNQPVQRTIYYTTTKDGMNWQKPVCISEMGRGSYQVSFADENKWATAFNYHPDAQGIAKRTNVYYVESVNGGERWQNAAGEQLQLPLTDPTNKALVYDAESKGRNIYVKDIAFDADGNPVILVLESGGWECGPLNDPRTWLVIRWDGKEWIVSKAFTSDNNYDTGSIFVKDDNWYIIAPTVSGEQAYNPGGEMKMWVSFNKGATWNHKKQLTANSSGNHSYARGALNAHPDFCAIWADGNARKPSKSNLCFTDKTGNVYLLPEKMDTDFQKPVKVELGAIRH